MINFENILKKHLPTNTKQPHRSQIYVGFQCHQHCGFCYYKNHYNDNFFDVKYIKRQIDLLLSYGITDIEITGGEPGEYDYINDICEYIKHKNPTAKIAIITNGSLYYKKNVWKLIDEVLISYHISYRSKNINNEIFPNGHTYNKVLKCFEKAKNYNLLIRTNSIISKFNLYDFIYIIEDLIHLQPNIINILPVNTFDDASSMIDFIDYTAIRDVIKTSIQLINSKLSSSLIFVRYMPFCDMEGYEKYIVDVLQNIYDWLDWNAELCGQHLLNYINKYKSNQDILNILGVYGSKSYDVSYNFMKNTYEKLPDCKLCKYNLICEGVEKTKYHKLLNHIIVNKGKMIKNPLEFIKNTSQDFYAQWYNK